MSMASLLRVGLLLFAAVACDRWKQALERSEEEVRLSDEEKGKGAIFVAFRPLLSKLTARWNMEALKATYEEAWIINYGSDRQQ